MRAEGSAKLRLFFLTDHAGGGGLREGGLIRTAQAARDRCGRSPLPRWRRQQWMGCVREDICKQRHIEEREEAIMVPIDGACSSGLYEGGPMHAARGRSLLAS